MISVEYRTSEHGTVENAALAKVKDILTFPCDYFTHGLNRDSKYGDRLEVILTKGLLSQQFSEKIGQSYESNWHDVYTDVCINYPNGESIDEGFGYAIWGSSQRPKTTENLCVLLVSTERYNRLWPFDMSITSGPMKNEARWKRRIAPRFLEGIVLADRRFDSGWDSINALEISPIEKNVAKAAKLVKTIYRTKPELAIPIYGTSGTLYWPEKIEYERLRVNE